MSPSDRLFALMLQRRRLAGWVSACVTVGLGIAIRLALADSFQGFPFVTFYPAVLITAVLGGWRPAAAAAGVALLFSWYFLIPPSHSFELSQSAAIGLTGDAVVAAMAIALVEIIHIATRRLQAKQMQSELLLAEREMMFRELQHRVANNMQFVASLLTLQANRLAGSEPGRKTLQEGASRLALLASLHRKLYNPKLAERGFEIVARDVLEDLLRGTGCARVKLEVRAEPIPLPLDAVTTLVLIATEVATNAVKHVFSKGAGARLSLTLTRGADGQAALTIADDGPGFAAAVTEEAEGLGLKILQSLADRLDGKLELRTAGGAVVTVSFPFPRDLQP